jgi:hypothetical protein
MAVEAVRGVLTVTAETAVLLVAEVLVTAMKTLL